MRRQRRAFYERVSKVLAFDPELEAWQLAERFGLNEREAVLLKGSLTRVDRSHGRRRTA